MSESPYFAMSSSPSREDQFRARTFRFMRIAMRSVYHLFRGSRGKAKTRAAAVDGWSGKAMPPLSNLHFPLGRAENAAVS